jgi:hypothetical protein
VSYIERFFEEKRLQLNTIGGNLNNIEIRLVELKEEQKKLFKPTKLPTLEPKLGVDKYRAI